MTRPDGSPDFAMLADWLEGRLDAAGAARVEAEVGSGDVRLRDAAGWLRRFLATSAAVPLEQPPPIVAQRLRQHFARWTASRAVLHPSPRRYDAVLVFDSRQDLATAGARGADTDESIHLAYVCEVGDIVLDATPQRDGRFAVDGQVLGAEQLTAPVFEVTATTADVTVRSIDGDRLGRFRLPAVDAGPTSLVVSNGELSLHLGFDLRDRS